MTDIVDPFHVKGIDGILRPLSKHCDSKGDVEQDPYGAWLAIQNQATEIERLRARVAELEAAAELNPAFGVALNYFLLRYPDKPTNWVYSRDRAEELARALIDKEAGDD